MSVSVQGARYSIPYFVNPKLNFVIQGPEKRWGPVTGFDLLSKTGGKRQMPARTYCLITHQQPLSTR